MASTFSTNLHLELQATGEHSGTWGSVLNTADFVILDTVLGGVQTLTLASIDVTLSTTQSQNNFIKLTGALGADVQVIFPAIGRTYFVSNATTGAHSVTLKCGAGTTVVIPQGTAGFYVLDGTNVYTDTISNSQLAAMAAHTIKGNATAGSAAPTDLTGTDVTALLIAFVGDSGAGGTKGLVPAPATGDAAAGKYLKADGTWATVPYPVLTSWVGYVPTINGFSGTSSVAFYSRRVGTNLELMGSFIASGLTASTATISIGFNGVNASNTIANYPASFPCGTIGWNYPSNGVFYGDGIIANQASTASAFFYLGFQTTSFGNMATRAGTQFATGVAITMRGSFPVTGWS